MVEVYYAGKLIETMPRIRGSKRAQIDYRHVIWSLVRKPGAFARYRYREELFPSLVFRRAYDSLRGRRQERADLEYLRILHLAATTLECRVEAVLETLLSAGEAFDFVRVRDLAAPSEPVVPVLDIGQPDLAIYDRMLGRSGAA